MFIIDRFEEEWAIIETENRQTLNFPRSLLPSEAQEGDVINITVSIDNQATEERRKNVNKLMNNFFDE